MLRTGLELIISSGWLKSPPHHYRPIEYDSLCLLATHSGQIMTHRAILSHVWGMDFADMTHSVRIYINQIRQKLHEDPASNIHYILNERGIGHRFVDIV